MALTFRSSPSFSVRETFYRGLAEVTKVFSDHGLLAQPYMNDCLPVSFRERIGMELDTMQILTRRV